MPVQKSQSPLYAKYGKKLDEAAKTHAKDETRQGRVPLPPGINGIAQLTECKFDTYKTGSNTGEYYFQARAVVIEPHSVIYNGVEIVVEGQQTMIQEPVCDTKNASGEVTPMDAHIDRIENHMRLLCGDEFTHDADGANLEGLAATALEAAPYFRFSTSVRKGQEYIKDGKKVKGDDGVWENWLGTKGLEDYAPPDGSGAPAEAGGTTDTSGDTAQAGDAPGDEPDMDALAVVADGEAGDDCDAAQLELTRIAAEAGISDADRDAKDNWTEVVELIRETQQGGDGTDDKAAPPAEPWKPKKGEVVKYQPPGKNPKTKKPFPAVQAEVTVVNGPKKLATLKNNTDKKTIYKDVAWDAIEPV